MRSWFYIFLPRFAVATDKFVPDNEQRNGEPNTNVSSPQNIVTIEADGPSETFKDEESKVWRQHFYSISYYK